MSDYRHPERFLGLDDECSKRENSAAWVLPVPLEMTTSYVGGTRFGPAAIIEASNQVELYDTQVGSEAALDYGVHTLPTLHPDLSSPQSAVESITSAVTELPLKDRLLVSLGGEHTITPGVVAAFALRYPNLLIVQIDAHGDLRNTFDGTPWSHACAMRRCLPYAHLLQFGIRSVCQEEVTFMRQTDRVKTWTAEAMHSDTKRRYLNQLRDSLENRPVYLTIDVDGLDPSILPATGTPEPGGIGWYDSLDLIRTVAENTKIIAFDCVELSPTPGAHASAFTAAKLIYKTLNYIMLSRGAITPNAS
ncbi:MAG: agmatinase [Chloroflexota bacterium]